LLQPGKIVGNHRKIVWYQGIVNALPGRSAAEFGAVDRGIGSGIPALPDGHIRFPDN
jgi:hypothetical protein